VGKSIKIVLLILLPLLLLIIPAGIIYRDTRTAENKIFDGVYINGEHVGGMSAEDAKTLLEVKYDKPLGDKKISIVHEDYTYHINYDKLNAHYDINGAVNNAYAYGKSGSIIEKTITRWKLKKQTYNIDLEFTTDSNITNQIVKTVANKVNRNPKDGELSFDGKTFSVKPDVPGVKVNEQKLLELIQAAVKPDSTIEIINVPADLVTARVTGEMLSNVNTKISSFTTAFKPSDVNRTGNLRIAATAINGLLLMPGEVFSMNKALGPRVESKGYKEAPVIINGTVQPGLAGGICQVTTTIYNAALLYDFDIVERRQHGVAVSYVGAGRDATISGDAIDFKFRNTNKYPIYISAVMGKSILTVAFYGANEHPGRSVQIATEVYERIKPDTEYIYDSTLETGKKITEVKPISGLKSKTYKKVFQDGKLVSSVLISQDYYKPVKGMIRVGTKEPSVVVPVTGTDGGGTGTDTEGQYGTYPETDGTQDNNGQDTNTQPNTR
jgi:vancomycin resistance protein YoaR